MKRPFRALHLSDVHFGSRFHRFNGQMDAALWARQFANDIEQALMGERSEQLKDAGYRHFDLLVLGGDLTWCSEPEGMDAAVAFFAEVNGNASTPGRWWKADRVLLLPGNHDMVFGTEIPKEKLPLLPRPKREALYRETYEKIFNRLPSEYLCSGFCFPEHCLSVAGFNSCRVESWAARVGFVGCDQIKALGDSLWAEEHRYWMDGRAVSKGWHRIAFLHHHVTPMAWGPIWSDSRPQALLDSDETLDGLVAYGFDMVFHGHFHVPDLRLIRNFQKMPGRVLSAGSAGVCGTLCENCHHFFAIEIEPPDAANMGKRWLKLRSFERRLEADTETSWSALEYMLPFCEPMEQQMQTEVKLLFDASADKAADKLLHYESYPDAIIILTQPDSPDRELHFRKTTLEFMQIWNARSKRETLPEMGGALRLMMALVRNDGPQLLADFKAVLLSEDAKSLAAFLVDIVYRNPTIWAKK